MVNPFQIQSMFPDSSSISFASHAIGCALYSRPRRFAASCASSRSKPVYSPLSPKNPIGGKSWSKPTISVPPSVPAAVVSSAFSEEAATVVVSASEAFVSAVVAAVLPDEQAAMDNTIIDAIAAHNTLFFIINFLLLYRMSSRNLPYTCLCARFSGRIFVTHAPALTCSASC